MKEKEKIIERENVSTPFPNQTRENRHTHSHDKGNLLSSKKNSFPWKSFFSVALLFLLLFMIYLFFTTPGYVWQSQDKTFIFILTLIIIFILRRLQ